MKKGFTLIELLAVIVILAIIALIATPIILGIINDAREESNERSVELYASAVRNGIAAHQLKGNEVEAKTYKSSELTFVEYDGDVVCDTVAIYEDGKIYVADCTVNGTSVEYTYGEPKETPITQIYKRNYYLFDNEFEDEEELTVGDIIPFYITLSKETPEGKNVYIGLDVEDAEGAEKITVAYACFVRNNVEYCLKGEQYSDASYATNKTVLADAFKDVPNACTWDEEGLGDMSYCNAAGLSAGAYSIGYVYANDDKAECDVDSYGGAFDCNEK